MNTTTFKNQMTNSEVKENFFFIYWLIPDETDQISVYVGIFHSNLFSQNINKGLFAIFDVQIHFMLNRNVF